jgi:putative aldouronate transport system permease protein
MQKINLASLRKHSSRIAGITTNIVKFRWQYAMLLPGVVCLFLFSYMPMMGVQIAFRNYRIGNTIWNALWVGLDNFRFFLDPEFWRILKNTLVISVSRFVFAFPTPIVLAMLINEINSVTFKRLVQSVTYLPPFYFMG